MSDANRRYWDVVADIDPKFTKAITGKQYRGTSPNPQYVIRCLTELFGPVGVGFGWKVLVEDFTPLGEKTLHWCRIEFWHTDPACKFESYGQTLAAYPTSSGGFMVDEDAPKKSLTDAIIKAASHIGIAANIFLGRWDDQKYVAEVNAEYRAEEKAKASPPRQDPSPKQPATPAQIADRLIQRFGEIGTAAELEAFTSPDEPAGKAWDKLAKDNAAESNRVKAAYDKRVKELEQAQ